MSSKYNNIRTADELQAAIDGVRREIKGEGKVLSLKYRSLKEHYSPVNMMTGLLKKNPGYSNWVDFSLRVVRLLRRKISKHPYGI